MAMSGPKGDDGGEGELFADINITPLTDIFLVLLIIFMVTSSVMATDGARAGVRVNLPKGATKEIASNSKDVTVAINNCIAGHPSLATHSNAYPINHFPRKHALSTHADKNRKTAKQLPEAWYALSYPKLDSQMLR